MADAAANERKDISVIFSKRKYPLIAASLKEGLPAPKPFESSMHEALNLKIPIQLSLLPAREVVVVYPSFLRVRNASP
jgi:hypothetical protein